MERACRHRLTHARVALFGAAFVLLTFVHFTFGPPWLWGPPIAVALGCVVLGAWGERILFPLAWRTFDAPQTSPALEAEARALARHMGVRLDALRTSRTRRLRGAWKGRTVVVPSGFRDLPDDVRGYALARTLAHAPDATERFLQLAGWPLFYAWFAAWQLEIPRLAWVLGTGLFPLLIWVVVREPARFRRERSQAREMVGPDTERAFLERERTMGSSGAEWELKRLAREAPDS